MNTSIPAYFFLAAVVICGAYAYGYILAESDTKAKVYQRCISENTKQPYEQAHSRCLWVSFQELKQ